MQVANSRIGIVEGISPRGSGQEWSSRPLYWKVGASTTRPALDLAPNFVLIAGRRIDYCGDMANSRQYLVSYRLLKGNSPQQQICINATDMGTARRIFAQQIPGATLSMIREMPAPR